MKLRVLIAESQVDDVLFLTSALAEIGEGQFWRHWVEVETHQAITWEQAAATLNRVTIDVVLLSLKLPDCQGAEVFRRAQSLASQIPVILLADQNDRNLAAQLVREGAQDFLLRGEIDCGPLAHALENAVERHRLLSATRAAAMTDPLTGLLNRSGFLTFAGRERMLADRLGLRLILIMAEPVLHPPENRRSFQRLSIDGDLPPKSFLPQAVSAQENATQNALPRDTLPEDTISKDTLLEETLPEDLAPQRRPDRVEACGKIPDSSRTQEYAHGNTYDKFTPKFTSESEQCRDLALVEAADHLRSLAGPTGLVARLGDTRFALTFFDYGGEPLETAWIRIQNASKGGNRLHRLILGSAIFDANNPAALEVLIEQAEFNLCVRPTPDVKVQKVGAG